jgi:flagellar basal body rod protein FlgG
MHPMFNLYRTETSNVNVGEERREWMKNFRAFSSASPALMRKYMDERMGISEDFGTVFT